MRGAQKYRPYFTAPELSEIIASLKESPTPNRLAISRYLESFNLKITHGVISPSHTLEPSIEQKLGFAPATQTAEFSDVDLFNIWRCDPTLLKPYEIAKVLDYRYRNNLMTTEEEKAYETSQRT
jgi:hypothetical protein